MKKTMKIISVILVALLLTAIIPLSTAAATPDVWDGTAVATAYDSGTGTETDPYIIKTAAQLKFLQENVKAGDAQTGKFFKLGADIDLNNKEWDPIGTVRFRLSPAPSANLFFSGNFNGAGYKIMNLMVSAATPAAQHDRAGLFGNCDGAVIKNVHIIGGNITETDNSAYVGLIVGLMQGENGLVSGCTVDATSSITLNLSEATSGFSAGGVAGRVTGGSSIENCINNAKIEGSSLKSHYVGGVVGVFGGSTSKMTNCINNGSVSIVCSNEAATTSGVGGVVGGFGAGANSADTEIKNCYNTAAISSYPNVGGIVGIPAKLNGKITACYNLSTSVTATNGTAGTIIGKFADITVADCATVAVGTANFAGSGTDSYEGFGAEVKDATAIKVFTDVIKTNVSAVLVYANADNPDTSNNSAIIICSISAVIALAGIVYIIRKKVHCS